MDIAIQIYLVVCGAVLPLVYFWSKFDIRAYLSIFLGLGFLAAFFLAFSPATALAAWPGSLATGGLLLPLAIYIAGSNAWTTNPHRSVFESMSLCSLVLLCGASQFADKDLIIPLLYVPAPFVALCFLITWFRKKKCGPPFFNTNHLAGYLILHLFTGFWTAINVSDAAAYGLIPITLALAFSACRGAWIGVAAGTLCLFCLSPVNTTPILSLSITFAALAFIYIRRPSFATSMRERWGLYITALKLISEKPVFGWGLQTLVKEQFEASLRIRRKHARAYMTPGNVDPAKDGIPADYLPQAHRVHNDFLEITQELGFFGLAILIMIFYQVPWSSDPVLSGALITVLAHALFFFPLRTIKIGAPFVIILGLMLAGGEPCPYTGIITGLTIAVLIFQLIRVHVVRRFMGVWYFRASFRTNDPLLKREFIQRAVKWDPDNSFYQSKVYLSNVLEHPHTALKAASVSLYRYDGSIPLWSAFDQYARALFRLGSLAGARHYIKKSLDLKPTHTQGRDFLAHLDKVEKQHGHR